MGVRSQVPLLALLAAHALGAAWAAPPPAGLAEAADEADEGELNVGTLENAEHGAAHSDTALAADLLSGLTYEQLEELNAAEPNNKFGDCEHLATTPKAAGDIWTFKDHNVACGANRLLRQWRLEPEGANFGINYTCCNWTGGVQGCEELETAKHDMTGLSDLTKLTFACPSQKSIQSFRFHKSGTKGYFKYKCCQTHDDWQITECAQEDTPATNKMDNKLSGLQYHNVKCGSSTVMTGFQMTVPEDGRLSMRPKCCDIQANLSLGIVKGICNWWGDPHFLAFDNPATPAAAEGAGASSLFGMQMAKQKLFQDNTFIGLGTYWIVKSKWISIQGFYESIQVPFSIPGLPPMPMYAHMTVPRPFVCTRIAIGGLALRGHRLVINTNNITFDGQAILTHPVLSFEEAEKIVGIHQESNYTSIDGLAKVLKVELPLDVEIKITQRPKDIDAAIEMVRLPGGQDGHCGNFNGDDADDTAAKIELRSANKWGVALTDNLFGAAGSPAFIAPPACTGENRSKAEEACIPQIQGADKDDTAMDNKTKMWLETCIYDVCIGGGDQFAKQIGEAEGVFNLEMLKLAPRAYFVAKKVPRNALTQGTRSEPICGTDAEVIAPRSWAEQRAAEWTLKTYGPETLAVVGGFWNTFGLVWELNDGTILNPRCEYAHWKAGHSWRTGPTTGEKAKSLCMEIKNNDHGKWKPCDMSAGTPYSNYVALCAHKKIYAAQAEVGPVMGRTACGLGMQLAMPKSKEEHDAMFAKVSTEAVSRRVWLGARFTGNRWYWDDDQPICGYTNWDANANQGRVSSDSTADQYLCMDIKTGKWLNCGDDRTQHYSIACESKPAYRPCLPGKMNMTDQGFAEDVESNVASVQGYCYYMGKQGHDCNTVCKEQMGGNCARRGTQRITESLTSCRSVVNSFGAMVYSAEDSEVKEGETTMCGFLNTGSVKAVNTYVNKTSPFTTCGMTPPTGVHRVCACTTEPQL